MFPPLYELIKNDAAVIAALGDAIGIRFDPFGMTKPDPVLPYSVWQTVGGSPENYINDLPNTDHFSVQIDVYGATGTSVRNAAKALRDALEPHCHITSWRGESTDSETKLSRYSFDISFYNYR